MRSMAKARIVRFHIIFASACLCFALGAENANADPEDDSWRFALGGGVVSTPKFPGSKDFKTEVVPVIGVTYGRFFVGGVPGSGTPAGVGVNLYQDSHWRLGAAISADVFSPRKESDDSHLHGLGDINRTARAGVFASYTYDWLSVRANVGSDILNKKQGTVVGLEVEASYHPTDRLTLSAGPGITWADSRYMQTFFGVDAEQSARSGLPAFDAKSGISNVRFSVGANYQFDPHWSVGARFSAARLRGDAAGSPIAEKASQNTTGVFVVYRF